jgi:hypothetical protein
MCEQTKAAVSRFICLMTQKYTPSAFSNTAVVASPHFLALPTIESPRFCEERFQLWCSRSAFCSC